MASKTIEQLFEALNESSAAVLEAVKAGNERTYRVSLAYLEEAEKGAQGMRSNGCLPGLLHCLPVHTLCLFYSPYALYISM